MKIELTEQQFRYLLDLVYIGNWVLNSTRGDDRIEEYDQVEGKVFSHCVPQGMPKLVERYRGSLIPSRAFADGGIHVGTEDMSEFADGWCTYNGDHISMYDVNAGSTKTMVQMVVRYVAETTDDQVLAKALLDVLDTPVSPELLPPTRNGEIAQKSEDSVGPYNLQDFFLYYLVDHGFAPEKVLRLADIAYGDEFDHATLKKWLRSYCRRLFSQQFKRSCLQDGPTLNGFSFSPRTGFSMPSDGSDALYLATVDALK